MGTINNNNNKSVFPFANIVFSSQDEMFNNCLVSQRIFIFYDDPYTSKPNKYLGVCWRSDELPGCKV